MSHTLGRIRRRIQRGTRTYYLDFRPLGRIWSSPGGRAFATRGAAQQALDDIRADFRRGKTLEAALAPYLRRTSPELTVRWKYGKWCERQAERVTAGEIAQSYFDELARYGKPGGYLDPIAEQHYANIGYAALDDLARRLAERGLSPKTRAHVLAALRTFYRWLLKREEIDVLPNFPAVTVPEAWGALLEPEAQRAVLDAIPVERRGIFLALAYHGLRPGEATRLDVADYDFRAGVVRIPPRKAKTKRAAALAFGPELRAWIDERVDPAGRLVGAPLFANPKARQPGGRWVLDALELAWRNACTAAGVAYVPLYRGTKHSSATAALRRGVSLDQIQAALRHADIRSTQRYARAAELAPVDVLDSVARVSLAPRTAKGAPET